MRRTLALLVAVVATASGVAAFPTAAVADAVGHGFDVSFPQCGEDLPATADFAVVGVNGGRATDTNPCLADQLEWASASGGLAGTDAVALYVNTANPGHQAAWWPGADVTRAGTAVTNPYGTCRGDEDAACAYVYGTSIASDDAVGRGVPDPGAHLWWLDVETVNTWSADTRANAAALEGMTTSFESIGARVGLYSTKKQWRRIAGDIAPTSVLAGLPSWLSASVSPDGALERCTETGLTPRSRVSVTQVVAGAIDADLACATVPTVSTPRIAGTPTVGRTLRAVAPGFGTPTQTSYQWSRSGVPVVGAVEREYRTSSADVGASVRVTITAVRPGWTTVTATSAAVTVGRPMRTGSVEVRGVARPGHVLRVTTERWAPASIELSLHWQRNGRPIAGATGSRYAPTAADAGAWITASVTGTAEGLTPATVVSGPVLIGPVVPAPRSWRVSLPRYGVSAL